MQIVPPALNKYCQNHTSEESLLIKNLVEKSERELEHTDMISGRLVGQLLAMLVRISGAKTILEIGTFVGYSALQMAEALPADGALITCDINKRYAEIAREAFAKSDYGHKIELRMGPALQTIEALDQPFDLIFLDADKNSYPAYYEALFPLLKTGGLLVIDNVLWDGNVLDPKDEKSQAIDRLNKLIAGDDRVEQVMLTVRDGLTVVVNGT